MHLTSLGDLVLRDAEHDASDALTPARLEVVLGPADPFNYSSLLSVVADSGPAVIVDPIFGIEQLRDIALATEVSRILMSKRGETTLHQLAAGLEALEDRAPEVRTSSELHDRLVIPDVGGVTTIGVSLNGVRKNITVVATLSARSSNALRTAFEALWDEASVLPMKPSN